MKKLLKVSLGTIFLCLFSLPAQAETLEELKSMMQQMKTEYEGRINTLEKKIDALETQQKKDSVRVEQLNNQQSEKVAAIESKIEEKSLNVEYVGRYKAPEGNGGLLVRNPFGFGSVSVGGYADLEYGDFENDGAYFSSHRWIINVGAQLHDRIGFNSELEIEEGGPNSANEDGEIKVEQAYMDYKIANWVNVRAGAVLVPFGRYNLYHDSDLQDLTARPIMARDIVPTTWTEAGGGIFGQMNPDLESLKNLSLSYEVYAVNGLDQGFDDTGLQEARPSLKIDNNDDKAIVGRLAISPTLNQELGFSGYWGEYDPLGNAIQGSGVDWHSTVGSFELISEYAYFDVEESAAGSSDVADFFQGAYAQLNYHFWFDWLNQTFLGKGFENPQFTLAGRYDWALIHDDGDADNSENNRETRYTLGFNYRPIENFIYKFEYQWNQANNETLERGDSNGFLSSVAIGF